MRRFSSSPSRALSLLTALVVVAGSSAQAGELVGYQADGWSYAVVAWSDPLRDLFFAPDFDDSAWSIGTAAFGNIGGPACPVSSTVATDWPANTDLLLRRTFEADPDSPVTIFWGIDNDSVVYVNGQIVGSANHGGCAVLDAYSAEVPIGLLDHQTGRNVIAVLAHDYGAVTFCDLRIDGQALPPTALGTDSWGAVKARYR